MRILTLRSYFSTLPAFSELYNPYTRKLISRREYIHEEQIFAKVHSTEQSYQKWKATKLNYRIDAVRKLIESILADKEELKPIIASQIGKSYQNIDEEFRRIDYLYESFIQQGERCLQTQKSFSQKGQMRVAFEPLGVALIFPFFSEPIFDSVINLIPCLICGNAALIKASDFNHFLGPYLQKKVKDVIGLPLIQEIFLQPNQLQMVAQFRRIKKVMYSGSSISALHIFQTLVKQRFIDCNLFFGGKDAAFVDKSANLELAAKQICKYSYYNNGLSYDCIERLYLHSEIESTFLQLLRNQIEKITLGDPQNPQTFLGPLCAQQTVIAIEQTINQSIREGAQCVIGGLITNDGQTEGLFCEPTLLSNCQNNMPLMQNQLRAPILCSLTLNSLNEFVQNVNENVFGTGVRIFADTRNYDDYEQVIKDLEVGRIVFNEGSLFSHNLPIQGWKHSGKGKLLSELSYEEYSIPKCYSIKKLI